MKVGRSRWFIVACTATILVTTLAFIMDLNDAIDPRVTPHYEVGQQNLWWETYDDMTPKNDQDHYDNVHLWEVTSYNETSTNYTKNHFWLDDDFTFTVMDDRISGSFHYYRWHADPIKDLYPLKDGMSIKVDDTLYSVELSRDHQTPLGILDCYLIHHYRIPDNNRLMYTRIFSIDHRFFIGVDGKGDYEDEDRWVFAMGLTDSDGDMLSDGIEEFIGTNPSNEDTDGDGAPDGRDINPLRDVMSTVKIGDFQVINPLISGDIPDVYFIVDLERFHLYESLEDPFEIASTSVQDNSYSGMVDLELEIDFPDDFGSITNIVIRGFEEEPLNPVTGYQFSLPP